MKLIVGIIVITLGIIIFYAFSYWISKQPISRADRAIKIIYLIAAIVLGIGYYNKFF